MQVGKTYSDSHIHERYDLQQQLAPQRRGKFGVTLTAFNSREEKFHNARGKSVPPRTCIGQAEYIDPGDAGLASPEKYQAAERGRGEAGDTADLIGIDCIGGKVQGGTNKNAERLPSVVGIVFLCFFLAKRKDGNQGDGVNGSEGAQIAGRGWTFGSFLPASVSRGTGSNLYGGGR